MGSKKFILETHPKIANEWNYKRNIIAPEKVTYGSKQKVWWKCKKNHEWEAVVKSRTINGNNCPYCGKKIASPEYNLQKLYPRIVKYWDTSKNSVSPKDVLPNTAKKFWWKCEKNHSWEIQPQSYIRYSQIKDNFCPFCSKRLPSKTYNLKTEYPKVAKEWDYKKNKLKPQNYLPGSRVNVFWVCSKKHEWDAIIGNRTISANGCPYCSNQRLGYGNDLKTKFPKIAKEWDYKKNNDRPEDIIAGTNQYRYWICEYKHEWKAQVNNRTVGKTGCPYCTNKKVGYGNDLKSLYPKLIKEWDFEKNTKNPEDLRPGSKYRANWICKKKHKFEMPVLERTSLNRDCLICSRAIASSEYNFKTEYPQIAKEWNYSMNKDRPEDFLPYVDKKRWFICKKDHSYKTTIAHRTKDKSQCPYCTNKKVGYGNDLKTRFPKIAKEWDYSLNNDKPEEIVYGSHSKRWWKCVNRHSWYQSVKVRTNGHGCPECVLTPRSKEEIYLLFELSKFFKIKPDDHKIKLNSLLDVDIIIRDKKIIIEYDGAFWHKNKEETDIKKTKELQKYGWTVIRVRETPLKIISRKYNVSSKPTKYKETSNKVLKKLHFLGYEINNLEKYLNRKTLLNKKKSDEYIDKILKAKANTKNV